MKADISRDSFDASQHYSLVLMQQGRVQLDADWNEQGAILLRQLRTTAADIMGPVAVVEGFQFAELDAAKGQTADFQLSPGRLYVDGIQCVLDAESVPVAVSGKTVTVQRWSPDGRSFARGQWVRVFDGSKEDDEGTVAQIAALDYRKSTLTLDASVPDGGGGSRLLLRRLVTYLTQPDLPAPDALPRGRATVAGLLYLDVWEQLVTALENDAMLEVALGGPDTAARVRTVVQARIYRGAEGCMAKEALTLALDGANRGLLRARVQPKSSSTDPCITAPDAGYRGPENQLYRVEVHRGGAERCSFKWSRENGSVLFAVQSVASTSGTISVALAGLGRDDRFGLAEGDVVELQNDTTALAPHEPAPLFTVQSIDRDSRQVTLAGDLGAAELAIFDPASHAVLRRWDHGGGDIDDENSISIPIGDAATPETWIDLEDGVQVQFVRIDDGLAYRTGDYWLIPARVATGSVAWPQDRWAGPQGAIHTAPAAQPPRGVVHHYAPLALLDFAADGSVRLREDCVAQRARPPQPTEGPKP